MRLPQEQIESLALDQALAPIALSLHGEGLEFLGRFASARVPVGSARRDRDGPLSPRLLRLAREYRLTEIRVLRERVRLPDGTLLPRQLFENECPPELASYAETRESSVTGRAKARIAVDASLLALLQQHLSPTPSVVIEVRGPRDPIVVRPNVAGSEVEALLAAVIEEAS